MDEHAHPPVVSVVPTADDVPDNERVMSLGDHIEELRRRLIVCLVVVGAVFLLAMLAYDRLWSAALYPLTVVARWREVAPEALIQIQLLGFLDGFVLAVRLALLAGLLAGLPVIVYETWQFVSPGLTRREKRAILLILSAGSVLFLTGAALAFFAAVPLAVEFLLRYNASLPHTATHPTMDLYVGFLTMCCLGFGLGFETPLVMMALARVGLITPEGILRYWRHAVLGMVVLGAVFTPPDPLTQVLLASVMAALFFLGYGLACWVAPKKDAHGELA